MSALISGIIISALTGLAFLAYKHATAFLRISKALKVINLICVIIILVWNAATSKAYVTLLKHVKSAEIDLATNTLASINFSMVIVLGIYLVFSLYLVFLDALPKLLNQESNKNSSV